MTQSEYKKKRIKAALSSVESWFKKSGWVATERTVIPAVEAFKSGSDFGREYQRGVEDELLKNLIGCLHKMFCTGPNIEKEKRDVRLALEAYERSKDAKP